MEKTLQVLNQMVDDGVLEQSAIGGAVAAISTKIPVTKKYPDISPLLDEKAKRRVRLARLSFEEKIAIVNKWRELSRQIQTQRFGTTVSQRQKSTRMK